MAQENIVLPLRRDMPKLLRLDRAIERLASWCSWRCPLAGFLLVLVAHVYSTPRWWQVTCDGITTVLVALLFCSSGFSIAVGAILVQRPHRWFERFGLLLGVFAGVALAALGLLGAWAFFRSAVLGL